MSPVPLNDLLSKLQEDQARRWYEGQPKRIEDYLAEHPELAVDREAILDLICSEVWLRAEAGEIPRLEEYSLRFPQLAVEIAPLCELAAFTEESDPDDGRNSDGPASTIAHPVTFESPPSIAELAPHFSEIEVLELIGGGGMGFVYRARQKDLDRTVALKILSARFAADPKFVERFLREARILAKLTHPHIVAVHSFGQAGGRHYLLMEYVEGVNLRSVIQAGTLTPEKALDLVPPMCAALQYAHSQGIVHRDIKPENILLDVKGNVKIVDFGLAKSVDARITHSRAVFGTPQYMAPEQWAAAGEVDRRADIYSLGVVLYEMLTGHLPAAPYEPPSHRAQVDRRIDAVVRRTLEREPAKRYQHVSEVGSAVEAIRTPLSEDDALLAAMPDGEPELQRWDAVQSLFTLPDWGWNIAKISACFLVPVLGQLALAGYLFDVAWRGTHAPGFQFSHIGGYLRRGLVALAAGGLAALPVLLFVFLACVAGLALEAHQHSHGEDWEGPLTIATISVSVVAFLGGGAALLVFVPTAWFLGGMQDRILAGLDWREIRAFLWYTWPETAHMLAMLAWLALLAVVLGTAMLGIGLLFTGAAFCFAAANLAGQLYRIFVSRTNDASGDPASTQSPKLLSITLWGRIQLGAGFIINALAVIAAGYAAAGLVILSGLGLEAGERWLMLTRNRELVVSAEHKRLLLLRDAAPAILWNTETHQPIGELLLGRRPITAAAFSPDAPRLYTGGRAESDGQGTIVEWHAVSGQRLREATGHTSEITAIAAGPFGLLLATGSRDRQIILWDAKTFQPLDTFVGHSASIVSLDFSPKGKFLLSLAEDNTCVVWDLNTRQKVHSPGKLPSRPLCAKFAKVMPGLAHLTEDQVIIVLDDWTTITGTYLEAGNPVYATWAKPDFVERPDRAHFASPARRQLVVGWQKWDYNYPTYAIVWLDAGHPPTALRQPHLIRFNLPRYRFFRAGGFFRTGGNGDLGDLLIGRDEYGTAYATRDYTYGSDLEIAMESIADGK